MYERSFRIGSIPVHAVALDKRRERPVVLFYHGLHTSKEVHTTELNALAQRGFLALGVDFQGHGERSAGDMSTYLKLAPWPNQAFNLILPTLEEIPFILDFLHLEGYRRFALAGISLGGLLAFGAPLVERRLEAVVAILGCPHWGAVPGSARRNRGNPRYLRRSPHRFPSHFGSVRLLAWNAALDEQIVTAQTRAFMEDLRRRFPTHTGLEYVEFPESGHIMRPQDWKEGWNLTLDWLSNSLG